MKTTFACRTTLKHERDQYVMATSFYGLMLVSDTAAFASEILALDRALGIASGKKVSGAQIISETFVGSEQLIYPPAPLYSLRD